MNKWNHPFGLLLLAAMVGELTGCAQTQAWLAEKPFEKKGTSKKDKDGDQQIAAADKKSGKKPADKSSKSKSSKELADAKTTDSKTAKTSKPKTVDTEHEKYAAADNAKKKKPSNSSIDAKDDSALLADAKSTKPAKPKPKVVAQNPDDLESLTADAEPARDKLKKSANKKSVTEEADPFADDEALTKKNVVQVKKEDKAAQSDEATDWADSEPQSKSATIKTVKSANIAESFEEELESPFAGVDKGNNKANQKASETTEIAETKTADAKESWGSESPDSSFSDSKKISGGDDSRQGLLALCPDAEGELHDLLKGLDATDAESLKQGLHRIGQMGNDGAAAAPLLRKMLKHEDAFVRVHSALAMARLSISSSESISVVTISLKSRDASLRSFGAAVLGEMGPQANDVLTALAESLKDRDSQVRLRVAEVLIRHDEYAYPALQTLLACLKEKDENVRWLATYSLAELAPESPEAVQALLKAAHDPVSKVQVGAVYALGEIGPYAKRSREELRRLQQSTDDEELKSAITYSIQQIEKESP